MFNDQVKAIFDIQLVHYQEKTDTAPAKGCFMISVDELKRQHLHQQLHSTSVRQTAPLALSHVKPEPFEPDIQPGKESSIVKDSEDESRACRRMKPVQQPKISTQRTSR